MTISLHSVSDWSEHHSGRIDHDQVHPGPDLLVRGKVSQPPSIAEIILLEREHKRAPAGCSEGVSSIRHATTRAPWRVTGNKSLGASTLIIVVISQLSGFLSPRSTLQGRPWFNYRHSHLDLRLLTSLYNPTPPFLLGVLCSRLISSTTRLRGGAVQGACTTSQVSPLTGSFTAGKC